MQELIWLNGEIMPISEARLSVEDRGYQFADGVYEVVRTYNGKFFTLIEHLERLERSAAGILIKPPIGMQTLAGEAKKLSDRSGIRDGSIYVHLTRGSAPRNHIYDLNLKPTLLFYIRPAPNIPTGPEAPAMRVISVQDDRWKKCWIKSIALLPNILAKNAAFAQGMDEAVFVEDGIVSECSSTNIFAVVNKKLVTHPVGPKVLPGITRQVILGMTRDLGIEVQERALFEAEALKAEEVFVTSTTREVSWVGEWNGQKIGSGKCGPMTARIANAFRERIKRDTA
jgi:D-alanine transaminase